MPRPTAAQLALGSATVVCSTVALLLLSGATTDAGIALAALVSLVLGLGVTLAAARGTGAHAGARGNTPSDHSPGRTAPGDEEAPMSRSRN
ncbi:hypothetical protein [Streptomyces roseolilacinus]|uniref:Uncharacterized protein n=1 Tax=Streptomyces roseolilacinus TaxID=66904 RepID=A0A918B7N9_9ACTN|nr:hypothetical protein [Streptomyces roseolilacinus]GGQ30740.1 hypothetical protein GCM10010249_56850 [Streptomyces roseolilacinus]